MKIHALFCDYDGTLAPLRVPRSHSKVPLSLSQVLFRIHERVPVAIVTAKDYSFIRSRTPFANAWSCVYGVETIVKGGARRIMREPRDLAKAVMVVEKLQPSPRIEYKKTSTGDLCGFCAEWSLDNAPSPFVMGGIIFKIRRLGFQVLHSSLYPTFDVTLGTGDKGLAVKILQTMLGIGGGLMFVGDSPADNPAFAVARVGIGVLDGGKQSGLKCDYLVTRNHLANFFGALLKNDLVFSEDLPWIVRRK
jgi:hypothetical protein